MMVSEGVNMYQSLTPNLMVESVEEALAFYTSELGFAEVTSVPNQTTGKLQFAIAASDSATVMFQQRDSLVEEYPTLASPATKPSCTLYIKVADLCGLEAKLAGRVTFAAPLHKTFYGADEFAILDPDGYILTFSAG
jgi:uncharacterized glyoxalase superfamily protein PhnB